MHIGCFSFLPFILLLKTNSRVLEREQQPLFNRKQQGSWERAQVLVNDQLATTAAISFMTDVLHW
ncbi:hypothetical protein EXN66_Car006251 [Channa argus]|uniref:Uncharacterized protein n=1 Tax=Channa argus TaxID=215402 RepID=A0A6G1PKR6_CHAAH|nr:hypothetical protein EXN66_Car006251 [Channa argus]